MVAIQQNRGFFMLLASYRKDKSGNDCWVSTEYGVRDSKSLFWDELPKEEQHNAIFKVLLRNFMVVDKKRLELERIKDSMMNKKLPTSNVESRKNWRHLNYQNMKDLAKCEQNFADFHAGNVDHLIDIIRANLCLFRNTSYGYIPFSKD